MHFLHNFNMPSMSKHIAETCLDCSTFLYRKLCGVSHIHPRQLDLAVRSSEHIFTIWLSRVYLKKKKYLLPTLPIEICTV